jgi:hypothetical protein
MLRPITIPVVPGLWILAGCEKKDKAIDPLPPAITIQGFQLFDHSGNTMGHVGPEDDDWKIMEWSALTSFEQLLLTVSDTTNTTNTHVRSTLSVGPFPNPLNDQSAMYVNAGDSVKFRLVVTDNTEAVLQQFSEKPKGAAVLQLDLSDNTKYPNKKSVRYYYGFSAERAPHFKAGQGDIRISEYTSGQNPISYCFN